MSSKEVVDEIIRDLDRIPREITTTMNLKKVADEVSKILQRKVNTRVSS